MRSIEATAAVNRARRVQLTELAVCGRCQPSCRTYRPYTGHKCPFSPKVLTKMGVVGIAGIPKAWPPRFDFGEEGRPSHNFSYFLHIFLPSVFMGDCSKFCVKNMKSTVRETSRGKRLHVAIDVESESS